MSQNKYRVLFYREDTDIQEASKPVNTIEEAMKIALKENPWQYDIEIVKVINWKVVDEDDKPIINNLIPKTGKPKRIPIPPTSK